MSETDYAKLMSDFWTKAGSSFTAAQQQGFKDMADRMAGSFMFPMQAFGGGQAGFGEVGENIRKLMASSAKLTEALGPAAGQDGVTRELLQKIFDPREWLSATGYMDENVRQLAEGPKLADVGHVERKFLNLMTAWSEVRNLSARHSMLVLEAWSKAATEFAGKLNETLGGNGAPGSRADAVDVWVEIANRHLLQTQRSAPFLETQRKLLRASSDLRLAQQEVGDYYSEMLGTPTRAEMDDLSRTVTELKREIRADKRRRRPPAIAKKTG